MDDDPLLASSPAIGSSLRADYWRMTIRTKTAAPETGRKGSRGEEEEEVGGGEIRYTPPLQPALCRAQ